MPYILINITVLLLNSTWNVQYANRRSQDFKNLSYIIEHSVSFISDSRSDSLKESFVSFTTERVLKLTLPSTWKVIVIHGLRGLFNSVHLVFGQKGS